MFLTFGGSTEIKIESVMDEVNVDFEANAEKVSELSARVDEELLKLDKDNLCEIGSNLGIRKGRIHENLSILQILREISAFIEKKSSESVEAALELFSNLLEDINRRNGVPSKAGQVEKLLVKLLVKLLRV